MYSITLAPGELDRLLAIAARGGQEPYEVQGGSLPLDLPAGVTPLHGRRFPVRVVAIVQATSLQLAMCEDAWGAPYLPLSRTEGASPDLGAELAREFHMDGPGPGDLIFEDGILAHAVLERT